MLVQCQEISKQLVEVSGICANVSKFLNSCLFDHHFTRKFHQYFIKTENHKPPYSELSNFAMPQGKWRHIVKFPKNYFPNVTSARFSILFGVLKPTP